MLMEALVKSSRSSRIAFSAAIIIIVAVAAYNWMVAPHTEYLHAAQQYEHMMGDVAMKNKLIKAKEAAKTKEVERLRAELAGVQTALFAPYEAKRFFSDIETVCNASNCAVSSINFLSGDLSASVETDSAIAENSAVVDFVGSYGSIINFLARLTDRSQRVFVPSLKISTFGSKPGLLECEMVVTIYTIRNREFFTNE
jgi:Tfp pilus assembly protein PilO